MSEVLLPDSESDYYWPDGLCFWFFSGARTGLMRAKAGPIPGMAAPFEVGTLNQYVKSYATNQAVDLGDILSLAISAQFYLGPRRFRAPGIPFRRVADLRNLRRPPGPRSRPAA